MTPIPVLLQSPRELAFGLIAEGDVFKVYTIKGLTLVGARTSTKFSIVAFGPNVVEALKSFPDLWNEILIAMCSAVCPPRQSKYNLDSPQGRAAARKAALARLGL